MLRRRRTTEKKLIQLRAAAKKHLGCAEHKHDLIESNAGFNLFGVIAVSLLAGAIMFVFNSLTPLAADDFNYHFIRYWEIGVGEARISSVADIFESMSYHYHFVNGRVVLHFIVEMFALLGKSVFNVANSAVYVILTLLIYKHCKGDGYGKHDVRLFILINVMLWVFVRSWGQTLLWMDGSVNYLWGSVIRLSALLPFRLLASRDSKKKCNPLLVLPAFIICALAGATNENTGAAFVVMTVLFALCARSRGHRLPAWVATGIFGGACGFAFMVLAPANTIRNSEWAEAGNSVLQRLVNIPSNFILFLGVPLAIFLALAYLLFTDSKKKRELRLLIPAVYVVGAVAGAGAMLATPYFPTRTWFGMTVMMITAVGCLLSQMKFAPSSCRRIVSLVCVFCCLWCPLSAVKALEDAKRVKAEYDGREQYISEQISNGNLDLALKKITPENEHSPLYGVADVSPEGADNWGNRAKAAYYGLNSVISE